MSNSKFLRYQDENGDFLIDACDDLVNVPEVPNCPDCERNPNAVVPNWRNLNSDEPFFNEKYCTYQIAISTSHRTIYPYEGATDEEAEANVDVIFLEYRNEAAVNLLIKFNKANHSQNRAILTSNFEYSSYNIEPREFSYLKLLYTVPHEIFATLDDADDTEEDTEETPDEGAYAGKTVTYTGPDLKSKLVKVRKGLRLYSRYYRVYQAIDGGTLIQGQVSGEWDGGSVFSPSKLDRYGDNGISNTSVLARAFNELDKFLNEKKLNLFSGVDDITNFNKNVEKIELTFSDKYVLTEMKTWIAQCDDDPIVFGKTKLKLLNAKDPFKDPTAMHYFANLDEMVNDLTAREPKPWVDFLIDHTFPQLQETFDFNADEGMKQRTTGGCLEKALADEAKQLGQDLLDSAFSIGDAIAYAFNKDHCKANLQEVIDEQVELGLIYDPNTKTSKTIGQLAKEQAFGKMDKGDQPFVSLCAKALSAGVLSGSPGSDMLETIWGEGFDKIKLCGLKNLAIEAIDCLFKGISLEKALSKMLASAMENMSLDNFSELFVGLPADKRQEIEDMARKRLEEGNLFREGTGGQALSDTVEGGSEYDGEADAETTETTEATVYDGYKPFEDELKLEEDRKNSRSANQIQDKNSWRKEPASHKRTLTQRYDGAGQQFSDSSIMSAYIAALIEVYKDDLLSVVDMMNAFPGGVIISKIILASDCPRPPIFDPNWTDFINSIDLPFCRRADPIVLPKMVNPGAWYPQLKDWMKIVKKVVLKAINQALLKIFVTLLEKICGLLGNAMCKILEVGGDILQSLPDVAGGRTTFSDVIREAVCGEDADQDQVDETIEDMFNRMGAGAAALADGESVKSFTEDLSSSVTRRELTGAFLGKCDPAFLEVVDLLIDNEYPQFRDAMQTKDDICGFFKDCGDLFPAEVKNTMDDFLNTLPDNDQLPVNPSLCATPQALEDFCNARITLLTGKCTPAQARQMCENIQDQMADDVGDLANLLQDAPIDLPPVISTPGCDNGLVPFQPEEVIENATTNLGRELKALELAFTRDMLNNGGFSGWGMLNLILCDTMGRPFTNHVRRRDNSIGYVDFIVEGEAESDGDDFWGAITQTMGMISPIRIQHGQYPAYVGEWLLATLSSFRADFVSNNSFVTDKIFTKKFEDLGFDAPFSKAPNINLLSLPDYGYNVIPLSPNFQSEKLQFLKKARKSIPDIQLQFKDNNNNLSDYGNNAEWSYGFNVNLYLSDLHAAEAFITTEDEGHQHTYYVDENGNGWTSIAYHPNESNIYHQHEIVEGDVMDAQSSCYPGCEDLYGNGLLGAGPHTHDLKNVEAVQNIYADNCRVSVYDLYNLRARLSPAAASSMTEDEREAYEDSQGSFGPSELSNRKFEFYSTDDTLNNLDLGQYVDWKLIFTSRQQYIPQVVLLQQMLLDYPAANTIELGTLKNYYDYIMSDLYDTTAYEISYNSGSFMYGAEFDDLTSYTAEYVVGDDQVDGVTGGTLYSDVTKQDGTKLSNDDSILGISRDQYINKDDPENIRVVYLDPNEYGGSFLNPPYYIKPLQNQGWLGLATALFPEVAPCKPYKSSVVDFSDIKKSVDKAYNQIPEDERLKADRSCVFEPPYHKILERVDRAAIEGIISAVIRIYVTTHMIKSLNTFTTFAPKFPDIHSSLYASYIIEQMEFAFRDPVGASWDGFTLFSDEEFWYAFLEQSVQMYGRLVDTGEILDPPPLALQACTRLNDLQEDYDKPSKMDYRYAKDIYRIPWYQTYNSYTDEKKFDAIKHSEDEAKSVLKELVMMELNKTGKIFIDNLDAAQLEPVYQDTGDFILSKLTQGGEEINIAAGINAYAASQPTSGSNLYTAGAEMSTPAGEEYVGYYHIHQDDNGNILYMAEKYHSDESHDELTPYANKVVVPIGDVPLYGNGVFDLSSTATPFTIEKYISINGTKMDPDAALSEIHSKESTANVSDIYPGSLELVYATTGSTGGDAGMVTGVTGSLGVKYGLEFSIGIGGTKYVVTEVDVDALDLTIGQTGPLEGNSKLLLCLLNKLKDDNKFKLTTQYIFPVNKVLASWAIYNDMALLPSIGQVRVGWDDYIGNKNLNTKPGIKITFDEEGRPLYSYTEGWRSAAAREGRSWFVKTWPEWDQVVLKNTKSRAKRFFRMHYNSFNFRPGDFSAMFKFGGFDPWKIMIKNLRENFSPPPGQDIMPWWKKRMQRPNPYNANNKLCTKDDEE